MGDTLPTDDQTESFSVASTLDLSEDNLAATKEVELQSVEEDSERCLEVTRTKGLNSMLGDDDLHIDAEIKEVDCHSVKELSKEESDGFQIQQDFDSELSKKVEIEGYEATKESPEETLPNNNEVLDIEEKSDVKKHTMIEQNLNVEVQKSESVDTKKSKPAIPASKTRLPSSYPRHSSMVMNKVQGKELPKDKVNSLENQGISVGGKQSHRIRGSVSSSTVRTNYTVPQPFALATDKRASIGGHPINREVPSQSHWPHRLNGALRHSALINSKDSKKGGSKLVMAKALQSESTKPLDNVLVKDNAVSELKDDDDDIQSISSVGSKASRVKAANSSGFLFKSDERAEKRKEFYMKLEERHVAKEEEKNQIRAKTKEELESEIKHLRKSLTFKATPMPVFYQEGVPKTVEPKKIPTTRAKSPKLGRRRRFANLGCQDSICKSGQLKNSELDNSVSGLQRLAIEDAEKITTKILKRPGWKSFSRSMSEKFPSFKAPESTELSNLNSASPSNSAATSADGFTDRTKVRESCEIGNSASLHLIDKDGVAEHPHKNVSVTEHMEDTDGEQMHKDVIELDGRTECMNKIAAGSESGSPMSMVAPPESDPQGKCGSAYVVVNNGSMKDNNVANSKIGQKNKSDKPKATAAGLANGTKSKNGKSPRHILKEENHDVKANKTLSRERLKASTPSFRSRQVSVGSANEVYIKEQS